MLARLRWSKSPVILFYFWIVILCIKHLYMYTSIWVEQRFVVLCLEMLLGNKPFMTFEGRSACSTPTSFVCMFEWTRFWIGAFLLCFGACEMFLKRWLQRISIQRLGGGDWELCRDLRFSWRTMEVFVERKLPFYHYRITVLMMVEWQFSSLLMALWEVGVCRWYI